MLWVGDHEDAIGGNGSKADRECCAQRAQRRPPDRVCEGALPRPLGSRPPLNLTVCGIFRDEAPYLAEWVTFHRLQGVEHFWLYDTLSEDDWRSELAPELAAGIVTVTPWPEEAGQPSAYLDCLQRHRDETRWMAFIDIDEFLFSPSGRRLPEVLRAFDHRPGVVANWRMLQSAGASDPPRGAV